MMMMAHGGGPPPQRQSPEKPPQNVIKAASKHRGNFFDSNEALLGGVSSALFYFPQASDADNFRREFGIKGEVKIRRLDRTKNKWATVVVKKNEFEMRSRGRALKTRSFGGPLPGESQKEFAKRRAGPLGRRRGL